MPAQRSQLPCPGPRQAHDGAGASRGGPGRIIAGALIATLAGAGAGCAPDESSSTRAAAVTSIAGTPLHASVIEMIAKRDGLTVSEARAQAVDTLRLAAARLEESEVARSETPGNLSAARTEHLLRTARARLWLREKFEPTSTPARIPRAILEANLADPMTRTRHFHDRVYLVCNILVLPSEKDPSGQNIKPAADDQAWRRRASAFMAPIRARLRQHDADLKIEQNCDRAFAYLGLRYTSQTDEFELRLEQFSVVNLDNFVAEFSERVIAVEIPGATIEPFFTEFGLHFVYVLKILEARLPDNSAPPEELRELRLEALRELIHPAWREHHFMEVVEEIRDRRVVRLGQEVSNGDGAAP